MGIQTSAGARAYIGTKLGSPLTGDRTNDLAALSAVGVTYTEIGELISLSAYGDEAGDGNYNSLTRGRTIHLKGIADAGSADMTFAFDVGDAGQTALVAAQADRGAMHQWYPIKVVYPDGETDYLAGVIRSNRKEPGDGNSPVQRTVAMGINGIVFDAA